MDKWEYDQAVFMVRTNDSDIFSAQFELKGMDEEYLQDGWEVMTTMPLTMSQSLHPNMLREGELDVRLRVTSVLVLFRRRKQ